MRKCPLCEFDFENVNLQEGRCPQCGSVVEWPEDAESSEAIDATQVMIPIDAMLRSQSPAIPVVSERGEETQAQREIAADVEQLWRESIQDPSNLGCTIKGPETGYAISDSVLAVLPREVRSPLNITDKPADYELLDVIGRGGVGVVYTARQASIDRMVALKMLREEYRNQNQHQEKFLAEAILTGELDHPNIVPIYDLGRNRQGELFYSMKNVIGTPWDRVIQEKSIRDNIDILLKVADAIAFAHSKGVVHRDLKPENVMLGSFGEVLVMDWGIAVATESFRRTSSILRSQAMGGTPAYMAPELATGPLTAIGPAADVYLLGAILFEILTGEPPHYGNDVIECVRNAAKNIIRDTTVTGELMEIAMRAMATIPRRRFRNVQAFQAAIRLYQSHSESLILSDNAEAELTNAVATNDYKAFSRAVFAFEEALSLWDGNESAKDGLSRSKIAYAETAYKKGDYDLGLSVLDASEVEHQSLVNKLQDAIKERDARQNRFKAIRKIAVALIGFIVIAGSIGMVVILSLYGRASRLNRKFLEAQVELKEEVKNTAKALELAKTQEGLAITASNDAKDRQEEAEAARKNAELSRLESIAQRKQAEESSYFAEIALVGASIQQNQFSIASEVLSQQEQSTAKSKIRHWEWGRHRFVVQGGSLDDAIPCVVSHSMDQSIECIDRSTDGTWIAIGKMNGECELWRAGEQQATARFRHGRALTDIDFNSSSDLIATSGVDDDNSGTICVWRLVNGQAPVREEELKLKTGKATTVAFSNDAKSEFIAAGDNKRIGRVWNWREKREILLRGHIDALTAIEFSPNSQWVVSSSQDGTVRVWNRDDGSEVQRFAGHNAPVLSVAVHPDGKRVVSGGADRRILLWALDPNENAAQRVDAVVQQLRGKSLPPAIFHSFEGHDNTIQDASFSLDGKRLVSSDNDNLVLVWNVPEELKVASSSPAMKLRGHGGWVRACRFAADGAQVISGGDDRIWKTWQLDRYREYQSLNNGNSPILDACYSPTGEIIATGHLDGTVGLWDPKTGERLKTLSDGHEYLTNQAKIASDGKFLVTAAGDNTLRLWDLQRGVQLALMQNAGRDGLFSLSRNGQWVVVGGDDQGVAVCNLDNVSTPTRIRSSSTSTPSTEINNTFSPVNCVSISDDGRKVVIGDKAGNIEFWDLDQGRMVNRVFGHSESVVECFVLAAGSQPGANPIAITVSTDGTVAWWDASSGTALPRERLRDFSAIQTVALSDDDRFIACWASLDDKRSRLWIWDLNTGGKLASVDLSDLIVQDMVFSSSRSPALILTTSDTADSRKRVWKWDTSSNQMSEVGFAHMKSDSLLGAVPVENDNNLLTFGGQGARLWRLQDGKELRSYRPSGAVRSVAFDSKGESLVTASDDATAMIWDVAKRTSRQKLVGGHSGGIRDVAFLRDGQRVVTSAEDGRIVVWDAGQGSVASSGQISASTVIGDAICVSQDGKSVAIGCDDYSIRIYDSSTWQQKHKLLGHTAPVSCLSFSSDGLWIASGSQDKTVRLWSVDTGSEITKLLGHSAPLNSVVFSSDGLRVLTASQDTTVRLWDLGRLLQLVDPSQPTTPDERSASLGAVFTLEYHSSEVTAAEFSPDGRTIVTASMDGKGVLWPSERIPPALRISNPNITYQAKEGWKRIDPKAVLCQPGSMDLDGATVEVSFAAENLEAQGYELALDLRDNVFVVEGSSLLYQVPNEEPRLIGSVQDMSGSRIKMVLTAGADHVSVQELIRRLAFRESGRKKSKTAVPHDIEIRIIDRRGQSGNAEPERVRVNLLDE